jgi:hypothetical protein
MATTAMPARAPGMGSARDRFVLVARPPDVRSPVSPADLHGLTVRVPQPTTAAWCAVNHPPPLPHPSACSPRLWSSSGGQEIMCGARRCPGKRAAACPAKGEARSRASPMALSAGPPASAARPCGRVPKKRKPPLNGPSAQSKQRLDSCDGHRHLSLQTGRKYPPFKTPLPHRAHCVMASHLFSQGEVLPGRLRQPGQGPGREGVPGGREVLGQRRGCRVSG